MHARFYGSSIGRFMRPDPINGSPANPQSWNLYAYVQNNPVNYNDPTGMVVRLGSTAEGAMRKLHALQEAAGTGGETLTMEKKEHSLFFGLIKWTSYELGTSNAEALGQSGNVGKALNEWIGSDLTLDISLGQDRFTIKGGGAYTELSEGGAKIHLDPESVKGAWIGGVGQTLGTATAHELGHSLYRLHPELLAASEAGRYGHVYPMGYMLRMEGAKTEAFPIAFENSIRPPNQQRPYWIEKNDYDLPIIMPSPLW